MLADDTNDYGQWPGHGNDNYCDSDQNYCDHDYDDHYNDQDMLVMLIMTI